MTKKPPKPPNLEDGGVSYAFNVCPSPFLWEMELIKPASAL